LHGYTATVLTVSHMLKVILLPTNWSNWWDMHGLFEFPPGIPNTYYKNKKHLKMY